MASPTDISLRRVLVGHRAAVNVVDFDDKYIVSASGDRTIKVTGVIKIPECRPQEISGRLGVMGGCVLTQCRLSGTQSIQTKFLIIGALL